MLCFLHISFDFILLVRFQCGREIKKSRSLWGLRLRLPPSPPTIDLPIEGQITDEVMSNLQMKGRKIKTFVPVEW